MRLEHSRIRLVLIAGTAFVLAACGNPSPNGEKNLAAANETSVGTADSHSGSPGMQASVSANVAQVEKDAASAGIATSAAPITRSGGCTPIQFKRGASSATVNGSVPPENPQASDPQPACYTLGVGNGQRAKVRLISGENVGITIPGVGDMRDSFDFTTQRGTYKLQLFQLIPSSGAAPFRLYVEVAASAAAKPGTASVAKSPGAMDGSCRAELGLAAAQKLAEQCKIVSPATHPPCHVDNPCKLIRDEIARGCSMYPRDNPNFAANCRG